ncbi:MAG: tRNA (N(6)-L-threonylcarbamoyladenosine(37)-C(2))-methylthiotransferase MtaB [Deltaproteobacteria bacterium]|nr:tRNA (N(6)-L-threonylcarbamoyladenosine(37)-C(2))-methylthiotransferase MtaB [Deltaproteobacteria bacterium]
MDRGRVCIVSLGCKVNQFEGEAMGEAMEMQGWEVIPFGTGADCTIINTCMVTARAQAESRRWIYRARRSSPRGILLAAGCYPQINPEEVLSLGADGVVGNQEKEAIPAIVEEIQQGRGGVIKVGTISEAKAPPDLHCRRFRNHTRAFLKIQDGCNARCSYCIIPLARGRSRSVPPSHVAASLRQFKAAGYREVVLAGIHLSAYGSDLKPKITLLDLLQQLEEAETPSRIRLSSMEPQETTPALIDWIASSKICSHVHLSLQSGSDDILRMMNRPYTSAVFRELVLRIAERMPRAAIGADVMVGFPGEDAQAFAYTYDLLQSLPISYLHVFPFSPRPRTRAAGFARQVGEGEKRERVQALRSLSREKKRAFYSSFLKQELIFLIEHRRENGRLRGLSRNYVFCLLDGGDELMGHEMQAELLTIEGERGIGKIHESLIPSPS